MRAAIRKCYGDSSVLSVIECEMPTPKPNEVRVQVLASTVNRSDVALLTGKPAIMRMVAGLRRPRLSVTGTDVYGIIDAVGSAVEVFAPGDRVWGFFDEGLSSHAEYTCIEPKHLSIAPHGMSAAEAAGCLEGAHYARNFLNKTSISQADKVLVHGASGAIGSALVQLCIHAGAKVCATASGTTKKWLHERGVGTILDYEHEDFTTRADFKGRFDYVFDAVGKSRFRDCRPLLKAKGVYMSSELGPWAENIPLSLWGVLHSGLCGHRVKFPFPTDVPKTLDTMAALITHNQFKPLLDRTYSLSEIATAFDYVMSGQKQGNVILEF